MDTLPKAPKKSTRFSNDSRYSRWWASRSNKKTKPDTATKPDTKNIEALLSAVNSSSQHVRNFYVTFLLAGLYIAIIIWSTTDMMLLKETPVNLPLLNAELPINGFYTFASYFYLLIHFNLLLQLCLLSDKLHGYNAALSKLEDNEAREYFEIRLFPFAFSHTLSGTQHSGILKFLLTTMVWITIIWLPLCLLIGLQVGFLAYHSLPVLEWQRWAIVADLGILTLFWPIIRSPDGKWITWVLRSTGMSLVFSWISRRFFATAVVRQQGFLHALDQRFNTRSSGKPMLEGILSLITLIVVIGFSWGVAVLPDSVNELWVADRISSVAQWLDHQADEIFGQEEINKKDKGSEKFSKAWLSKEPSKKDDKFYFRLTEYLFDGSAFHRNLRLREKLLIANELKPEDVAYLTDDVMYLTDNDKQKLEGVLRKIVGLDLKGRDLRYADFSESLMAKVDFREITKGVATELGYADFQGAKLFKARMFNADLQGAVLNKANLQEAKLRGAKFQGANLGDANLQGAKLIFANFQGAELPDANLIGAYLNGANFQDAYLPSAQFQGASLSSVNFRDANLGSANFQGANLKHAKLQGAYLDNAELQGADLEGAYLQGANLWSAKLQGANLNNANLQGVTLNQAELQGAYLGGSSLQGADLEDTQLQGAILWYTKLHGANLERATLTLSNLTEATLGKLSEQKAKDMYEQMSQIIKNPERLKAFKDRLSNAIKTTTNLTEATGKNIWPKDTGEIVQTALKESAGMLKTATSAADYQNRLTAFLIGLACKDKWVADGIIHYRLVNMPLISSFAQCLLDKKNKSGLAACPGLSEISKEDIDMLKHIASLTNSIQATFKCEI